MDDNMSIDKKEDMREHSMDSIESTPEDEAENEIFPSNQDHPEQPKRKGGRKPIYATSEERKQRNRQAQAAFRERRTEYIKQLEETIRVHETNLHSLQTAHRGAADECLMLRYKNSLLERILLEKGIDVQAELRAKTGSPSLGPTNMPPNMPQPPTVQRAIMNRHNQARRSNSNIAPKLEPAPIGMGPATHNNPSPQSRPTPSSHHSSPSSSSPGFPTQGVMTPPGTESQLQLQQQHRSHQQLKQHIPHGLPLPGVLGGPRGPPMKGMGSSGTTTMGGVQAAYYSSFQNHIGGIDDFGTQGAAAPGTGNQSEAMTPCWDEEEPQRALQYSLNNNNNNNNNSSSSNNNENALITQNRPFYDDDFGVIPFDQPPLRDLEQLYAWPGT